MTWLRESKLMMSVTLTLTQELRLKHGALLAMRSGLYEGRLAGVVMGMDVAVRVEVGVGGAYTRAPSRLGTCVLQFLVGVDPAIPCHTSLPIPWFSYVRAVLMCCPTASCMFGSRMSGCMHLTVTLTLFFVWLCAEEKQRQWYADRMFAVFQAQTCTPLPCLQYFRPKPAHPCRYCRPLALV